MAFTLNHTLSACGKKYTFNIGGSGCEKRVGRDPTILNKDNITIYCYGQDSIGVSKLPDQLLLSLADGHGKKENGRAISYKIHEYLLSYMAEVKDFFIEYLRENNQDAIKNIVVDMFGHIDNVILNQDEVTSKFKDGGTTFTLIQKIIDPMNGDLYTLSYNVGDSPYLKISSNNGEIDIDELSENQNCDNIKCVEDYANMCVKMGVKPYSVILGRFNTDLGFKAPWMGEDVIKPYIYDLVNGKYTLSVNTNIMKRFYENAPEDLKVNSLYNGGTQSIRDRKANIKELSNGNYPVENFGSTLAGCLQTPQSFGDKYSKQKYHTICVPHVSIQKYKSGDNSHDLVSSDGAIDCLTNEELSQLFKYKITNNVPMPEFLEFLENSIDIQAALGGFGFTKEAHIPTWDDLSYWIVETTFEEDLHYKISKLEQEYEMLYKLAEQIKLEIQVSNEVLDALTL